MFAGATVAIVNKDKCLRIFSNQIVFFLVFGIEKISICRFVTDLSIHVKNLLSQFCRSAILRVVFNIFLVDFLTLKASPSPTAICLWVIYWLMIKLGTTSYIEHLRILSRVSMSKCYKDHMIRCTIKAVTKRTFCE